MADKTFIAEHRALALLMQADYTETQARAILTHSKKQAYNGGTYYPLDYIMKRASANQNKAA